MAKGKETKEVIPVCKYERSTYAVSAEDKEVKPAGMGEASSSTGNTSSSKSPKPFVLKKWDAVALWTWDIVVDTCAICRNDLMAPCIECHANLGKADEECRVAWGACNHAFHLHCVTRWLKTRQVCPLDNSAWDTAKIT